jgi:nitrogen fixation/metabolism regulation signal transduction histidine kinase
MMKIKLKVFFLAFLVIVLLVLLLASRISRPVSGVTEVRLVAGCQVELHVKVAKQLQMGYYF